MNILSYANNNIQVLRAIAAIAVVFYHLVYFIENKYGSISVFNGFYFLGKVGVDIFFIISGYIITFSISKSSSAFSFLLKRCLRIFPLYWLFLVAYVLILLLVKKQINVTHVVSSIFLIPYPYFTPILNQGWTLQFELYFYFIMAISLFICGKRTVLFACFLMLFLYWLSNFFELNVPVVSATILFEFAYGMIIFKMNEKLHDNHKFICLLFLFTFPLFIISNYNEFNNSEYRFIFSGFFSSNVVMFFLGRSKELIFFDKILVLIGNASYSLYLSHGILIYILCGLISMFTSNVYLIFLLAFLLIILISCYIYIHIESKINKYVKSHLMIS